MSRVLITGGAGMLGATIARRLIADPAHDVRIADERDAPRWMREACEIRSADLRVAEQAQASVKGCAQVIHLASYLAPQADRAVGAHTRIEYENALHNAVIRAALDAAVERFVYVSSPLVFERAQLFPTPEDHLAQCPAALSAAGYSRLTGERYCWAAHDEHGFPFTICRPSATYGPWPTATGEPGVGRAVLELIHGALAGRRPLELAATSEQTMAPTHVEDAAGAILAALDSPAALNEDFNLSSARELSVAEIARVAWQACGGDPGELTLKVRPGGDVEPARSWPASDKARELLGWQAQIELEQGVAATVAALR